MTKKYCVIDGNSLMHRAFHAISAPMTDKNGIPTNAIFGFLNMFFKYINHLLPDVTICTFDCGKATHRIELYSQYKASRPHMDDNLRVQFPIIEEILTSMDVPIIKVEGWEGDDVMGTIAKHAKCEGAQCYLVTGDKDMNQLVNDSVFTVTSDRKNSNVIIRGIDEVYEKFRVYPEQIIDYLAFVGDKSDDIPGVPSIGEKSAVEMLAKYKNMDNVYENLIDFKGKKLTSLKENKELGYLSKKLATINTDLDLNVDISAISSFNYDEKKVECTLEKYQLKSPYFQFKKTMQNLKNSLSDVEIEEIKYPKSINFNNFFEYLKQNETMPDSNIALLGISKVVPTKTYLKTNPDSSITYGFSSDKYMTYCNEEEARKIIAFAIDSHLLIGFDLKPILQLCYPHNNLEECTISEDQLVCGKYFDNRIALNMIDSSLTFKKPEEYFSRSASENFDVADDISTRASKFAYISLQDQKKQSKLLENQGEKAYSLFNEIEMKLIATLIIIERNGARIDESVLSKLNDQLEFEIDCLKAKIFDCAGKEFNLDSPQQLSAILFDEMQLPHKKKTKTGYSTDSAVLTELSQTYEIAYYILRYRELAKLKSTYVDGLSNIISSDKLVHTQFNQGITATGRLSSSEPNLQNIPVRTQLGKHIREAFLSLDEDSVFMSADYSQIELRLLAHLSEDENMISAFIENKDLHTSTAAKIFKIDESQVTSEMRSRAKAVNFGIVYGQQAFSLSKELEISYEEAKYLINSYYETYPKVKIYLDEVVNDAVKLGFTETIFGRRRTIKELSSMSKQVVAFGERTAKNHPMQGSAADIIKLAMIEVSQAFKSQNLESKILIQVHDELDLSIKKDEIETASKILKNVMENVVKLKVPLKVDINWGNNWAEAH